MRYANLGCIFGSFPMKHHIRTLGAIFSVALNIAFVGSYAYRTLTSRPTFAYEEMRLDDDQRARIISSRDRFLYNIDRIGNDIVGRHADLVDAIAADSPDRTAIQARLDEIRSLQQSMQQVVVEHLLEDRGILRPAQRQQFFALLKERIRSQSLPGPPWLPRDRKRQR